MIAWLEDTTVHARSRHAAVANTKGIGARFGPMGRALALQPFANSMSRIGLILAEAIDLNGPGALRDMRSGATHGGIRAGMQDLTPGGLGPGSQRLAGLAHVLCISMCLPPFDASSNACMTSRT